MESQDRSHSETLFAEFADSFDSNGTEVLNEKGQMVKRGLSQQRDLVKAVFEVACKLAEDKVSDRGALLYAASKGLFTTCAEIVAFSVMQILSIEKQDQRVELDFANKDRAVALGIQYSQLMELLELSEVQMLQFLKKMEAAPPLQQLETAFANAVHQFFPSRETARKIIKAATERLMS